MDRHFTSLKIDAFRGIKHLELNDLSAINILVGANNCGKTTLLEAIMVLSKPSDFANLVRVSRLREMSALIIMRGLSFYDSFLYLFSRLNEELYLSVSGILDGEVISTTIKGNIEKILLDIEDVRKLSESMINRRESIVDGEETDIFKGELLFEDGINSLIPNPTSIPIEFNKYSNLMHLDRKKASVNMTFISAIDHIIQNSFNNIIKDKELKNQVVSMLKIFDENITDLRSIQDDNGRIMKILDHELMGYLPISSFGDGIKKVIALANGIAKAKNGVLLVDEIETSIHASVLKSVISYLYKACKENNVQLFVTTHSLEVVDALLITDDSSIQEDKIRVITLVKKSDKTIARTLTGEKALQVRDEYDMELRT